MGSSSVYEVCVSAIQICICDANRLANGQASALVRQNPQRFQIRIHHIVHCLPREKLTDPPHHHQPLPVLISADAGTNAFPVASTYRASD